MQLFRERLSEKKVHATIPKGNMGYDQCTPDTVAVKPAFVSFSLALANMRPCFLGSFFQITLKNSELISCGIVSEKLSFGRSYFPFTIYSLPLKT